MTPRLPTPYWFTPPNQTEVPPVEFLIAPLTMRALWDIQASMTERGIPSSAGLEVVLEFVKDWRGASVPYSIAEKQKLLDGEPHWPWVFLLGAVAAELYRATLLRDAEKKTSQ